MDKLCKQGVEKLMCEMRKEELRKRAAGLGVGPPCPTGAGVGTAPRPRSHERREGIIEVVVR